MSDEKDETGELLDAIAMGLYGVRRLPSGPTGYEETDEELRSRLRLQWQAWPAPGEPAASANPRMGEIWETVYPGLNPVRVTRVSGRIGDRTGRETRFGFVSAHTGSQGYMGGRQEFVRRLPDGAFEAAAQAEAQPEPPPMPNPERARLSAARLESAKAQMGAKAPKRFMETK